MVDKRADSMVFSMAVMKAVQTAVTKADWKDFQLAAKRVV